MVRQPSRPQWWVRSAPRGRLMEIRELGALAATYRLVLEARHSESPDDDLMVSGGWR